MSNSSAGNAAQEIATNRMLQDVAHADVVVVNPTHYAVALKWNRKGRAAPICVAKGVDEVAARIRAKAAEAGVPVQSDPSDRARHLCDGRDWPADQAGALSCRGGGHSLCRSHAQTQEGLCKMSRNPQIVRLGQLANLLLDSRLANSACCSARQD